MANLCVRLKFYWKRSKFNGTGFNTKGIKYGLEFALFFFFFNEINLSSFLLLKEKDRIN